VVCVRGTDSSYDDPPRQQLWLVELATGAGRPLVDDPDVWAGHFLDVPEESGAHVVLLDADTVLMAASAPQSAALFEARGFEVVTVDISEFEKMEGCVTCLSVRLRGVPA
jgi:dimethylargininase